MGAISVANLTVNAAGSIQQSGAWSVTANTSLTATDDIALGTHNNSLAGALDIASVSTANVSVRNASVSATVDSLGTVNNFTLVHTAAGVSLAGLDVDNLVLDAAGDIEQTGAWSVDGTTSLTATGNITLNSTGFSNAFDGAVSITGGGATTAAVRNTSATAEIGTVSNVHDLIITHTANSVSMGAVTIANNLTVSAAGDIVQTGLWSVGGDMNLSATGDITLLGFNNLFDGTVTLSGTNIGIRNASGSATIDSIPTTVADLTIIHTTAGVALGGLDVNGGLTLQANGNIQQTSAWDVDGDTVVDRRRRHPFRYACQCF